ncbi:MAG: hypothetical protein GY788_29505 [bacterium]|nr:hypothetical protein [bacterium]
MARGLRASRSITNQRTQWGRAHFVQLAAAHTVGTAVGGGLLGLAIWILMVPARGLFGGVLAPVVVCAAAAFSALRDGRLIATGTPRQLETSWVNRYGLVSAYFRYGVLLGFAVRTHQPIAGLVVVAAVLGTADTLVVPVAALAALGMLRGAVTLPESLSDTLDAGAFSVLLRHDTLRLASAGIVVAIALTFAVGIDGVPVVQ